MKTGAVILCAALLGPSFGVSGNAQQVSAGPLTLSDAIAQDLPESLRADTAAIVSLLLTAPAGERVPLRRSAMFAKRRRRS